MNLQKTTVAEIMTPAPHGIAPEETLETARKRLQQYKVRHLPVRIGGRVIGILSERDLELVAQVIDAKITKVKDVMTPDPYSVGPTALLKEVAATMFDRRIGSALIVDASGQLLGIFTDTDALRLLTAVR